MSKLSTPKQLDALRRALERKRGQVKRWLVVSSGTCGQARGSHTVVGELVKALKKHKLTGKVGLRVVGCIGFCETEPNMVILPEGIFYQKLKPEDAATVVEQTVVGGQTIERLLYTDPATGRKVECMDQIPFYARQHRLVSGDNFQVDPTRIEDYIAIGGYAALAQVLGARTPEKVIDTIKRAGLRGRGGAGFSTGTKWEICRKQPGNEKYVICNADEGDPGAYMDRSLLEGNPLRVIEGMTIGAYAMGANTGYVYVRSEYPLAVTNVGIALKQARRLGLLGRNILGSGFSFDIEVAKGAGAFVCGEETALIASIEGKVGIPRQRPPFPAEKGLRGKPTNINNVETWATVPLIVNMGATRFAGIGTETSKGTKIFSLVGKVTNTGLVEVPMGITLKEVVTDIGGGIPDRKGPKAIQTGGPSGGCIPKKLWNLPVDYESLARVGAMMGSGGMIVMDEDTCMVDVARYFMNFLRDESCGKCLSCREGTQRMWEILDRITQGEGRPADIDLLAELAQVTKDASMCGLGQTAANPVLSTLRYFRDEYDAHVDARKCPAHVCKPLITFTILKDKCTGCMACLKACPAKCITGARKEVHVIDQVRCTKCGSCRQVCKFDAVEVA
jgi:NADH-quinone oxidoreductase subunit F